MDKRADAVAELEDRLGHVFADRELLERALTHASVGSGSRQVMHNERLEFLGDRVLGLLAAETLVARHPDWREGELTRRHVTLVAGKTCAEVARRIGLPAALRLAGGASKQGGRDNDRILGDAMEALMAAVYLDGGLAAARAVFAEAWTDAIASAVVSGGREPKTALQEWAMAAGLPLPSYCEVSRTGPDHAPLFVVEVTVQGYAPERAVGSTLREAEKAAALALLAREGAA
ncbi:MAG TPA: ribonuclease III [Caulobacteraceae bacterium]